MVQLPSKGLNPWELVPSTKPSWLKFTFLEFSGRYFGKLTTWVSDTSDLNQSWKCDFWKICAFCRWCTLRLQGTCFCTYCIYIWMKASVMSITRELFLKQYRFQNNYWKVRRDTGSVKIDKSLVLWTISLKSFTLQGTNISIHIRPWEKETYLQKCLGRGYVSSLECIEL